LIYNVTPAPDGGYFLAGETKSFGNSYQKSWLIKTDSEGLSGCHETSSVFSSWSVSPSTGRGLTIGTGGSTTSGGTLASVGSYADSSYCFSGQGLLHIFAFDDTGIPDLVDNSFVFNDVDLQA